MTNCKLAEIEWGLVANSPRRNSKIKRILKK